MLGSSRTLSVDEKKKRLEQLAKGKLKKAARLLEEKAKSIKENKEITIVDPELPNHIPGSLIYV